MPSKAGQTCEARLPCGGGLAYLQLSAWMVQCFHHAGAAQQMGYDILERWSAFPPFLHDESYDFEGLFCPVLLAGHLSTIEGTQLRRMLWSIDRGFMTALDVAASNMSFLFITVAFYTMLKSASLIFILVFGLLLRMEQCSLGIAGTVLLIAFGIFITSYGETEFDATGFWLVLSSEVFAAMRWLATQKTLHSSGLSAMQTVLFMSPASSVTLAPIVVLREWHELTFLAEPQEVLHYFLLVLVPGFLAFLLLLIEVQLVKVTSSLTLSVFGNLKSVVTIIFSIVVFGETTTLLQWSGLLLALTGMLVYARLKNKSLAVDSLALVRYEVLPQEDEEPLEGNENGCGEVDVQIDEPKVPPPSTVGAKTAPVEEEPQ